MKFNEDLHIFIPHYIKLTQRKEYLDAALKEEGFSNIHWYDHIDRDTLTSEHLSWYQYSPEKWNSLNAIWKHYDSPPRQLSPSEIAVTVTHILIYNYIIDKGLDYVLILEDDIILYNNFTKKLKRVIQELPDDFDACFLSDNFGWTVDNYKEGYLGSLNNNKYTPEKCIYKMPTGKCADAYLLSYHGAKILYENTIPFYFPIDWMHTPIFLQNNMNIYWAEPSLTHQGSDDIYGSANGRSGGVFKKVLKKIQLNQL